MPTAKVVHYVVLFYFDFHRIFELSIGESIWDYDARNHPEWFAANQTGDEACDSYHKADEDVGKYRQR